MQGPGEAPGADTEPCVSCSAARLPLGNAAGKVPLSSSLLAHSSWHSPAGHPVPLQSPAPCQHTAPPNTWQQGQQHTETPSSPCSLSRMHALQEKMGRFGVFLAAWNVTLRKMSQEAFGGGWCSPQPVSLPQG